MEIIQISIFSMKIRMVSLDFFVVHNPIIDVTDQLQLRKTVMKYKQIRFYICTFSVMRYIYLIFFFNRKLMKMVMAQYHFVNLC